MSDGTDQPDDLEARIANAIELARAEQERWQAQTQTATDEAGQLEAAIHLAASKSVVEVLEEVLEPGTHFAAARVLGLTYREAGWDASRGVV